MFSTKTHSNLRNVYLTSVTRSACPLRLVSPLHDSDLATPLFLVLSSPRWHSTRRVPSEQHEVWKRSLLKGSVQRPFEPSESLAPFEQLLLTSLLRLVPFLVYCFFSLGMDKYRETFLGWRWGRSSGVGAGTLVSSRDRPFSFAFSDSFLFFLVPFVSSSIIWSIFLLSIPPFFLSFFLSLYFLYQQTTKVRYATDAVPAKSTLHSCLSSCHKAY